MTSAADFCSLKAEKIKTGRRYRQSVCLFGIIIVSLAISFCKKADRQLIEIRGQALGAKFSVQYMSPDSRGRIGWSDSAEKNLEAIDETAVAKFLENFFIDLQNKTSLYQEDSELIRLNNAPENQWIAVSDDLGVMITFALDLSRKTDGYYDITAGSISKIWATDDLARLERSAPDRIRIEQARQKTGYENLQLKKTGPNYFALKSRAGLVIDLASLAAGFGADQLAGYLEKLGIQDYLIDVGGEFRASGTKNSVPWTVGIENPSAAPDSGLQPLKLIHLRDYSMATSGTYKNYIRMRDQEYSHIMDPHTGKPVGGRLVSVTVLDPECMKADALATALIAMGDQRAWQYALQNHLPVFMVLAQSRKITTKSTPEFEKFLE